MLSSELKALEDVLDKLQERNTPDPHELERAMAKLQSGSPGDPEKTGYHDLGQLSMYARLKTILEVYRDTVVPLALAQEKKRIQTVRNLMEMANAAGK
jgi:hypothetical protein